MSGEGEQETRTAALDATYRRDPTPPAAPSAETLQGHLEHERLAGPHHTAEPNVVDAAEEGEPPAVPLVGEKRDCACLSERFELQHSREDRVAREVPREKGLVARNLIATGHPHPGLEVIHAVDEAERWPLWQQRDRIIRRIPAGNRRAHVPSPCDLIDEPLVFLPTLIAVCRRLA